MPAIAAIQGCLLLLAKDLGYLQPETYSDLEERYTAVSKMLNALLRALPA